MKWNPTLYQRISIHAKITIRSNLEVKELA